MTERTQKKKIHSQKKKITKKKKQANLETGKLTLQWWQCETQEERTDKESQPRTA